MPPDLAVDDLLKEMSRDKKANRDGLAFSFIEELGACKLVSGVSESQIQRGMIGS
jgi:3-dehydroquinate synthetase